MVATIPASGPVVATEDERAALADLASLLDAGQGDVKLVGAHGAPVDLPATVRGLLHEVIRALARDQPVAVVALQRNLTIHRAADLLNVRVPYMVQLLDRGDVPSSGSGARRRILFEELMAYKARRDVERREALAELTRISQEMGLYDLEAEGKLEWRDEDGASGHG